MTLEVAIIDYQMSNLHSVYSACNKVGLNTKITSNPSEIFDAKIAILPGVGSFKSAMNNIGRLKLDNCIHNYVESGKTLVGICLGLQLLFSKSYEFGKTSGLDIIKGSVKKFEFSKDNKFSIPHINWNKIVKTKKWENTPLCRVKNNSYMYFVHSYYVEPEEKSVVLSETVYGNIKFCSAISKNNIFATQFHPEKSSKIGLDIYESLKDRIIK